MGGQFFDLMQTFVVFGGGVDVVIAKIERNPMPQL